MDKRYFSTDLLPIMLTITEASKVLGISRSKTYQLVKSISDFPVLTLGKRLMVPRDQLLTWIDKHLKH